MATNAAATVLLNYISNYQDRLDKGEQRPSFYGGLELFKAQTANPMGILDEQVKQNLSKSFNVSVQVPVINYKDITIGNVRSCAMKTEGITTALVTLTAVTYVWGFVLAPMQHYENYVSYQDAFDRLMEASLQKAAATIDAACINTLETRKNQYFPQPILDYYSVTGQALQVPQAEKNDFYNQLGSIMQTMDYSGTPQITTNPIGMAMVRRYAAQGTSNAVNESFQFLGYQWFPTNRITNGAGVESTLYSVAPGYVAIWSRVDPSARLGERIHESKYWTVMNNAPYLGMDLGVYFQADCADISALQASGLANLTRAKIQSWEFSVDVFYVYSYNSNIAGTYQPILKVEILA